MDSATIIAIATSAISFLGTLAAGWYAYKHKRKEIEASSDSSFRDDIIDFTKTLTKEINELRDRIHKLESDIIVKNKAILDMQYQLAMVANVLIRDHDIKMEDLLKKVA